MSGKVKKNPVGRPYVMTKEVLDKLTYAFTIGASVEKACTYAEIDPKTFYNNAPVGSELFQKFKKMRDKPLLKALKTLYDNLDDPDNAKWFLERKLKDEFSTKTTTTVEFTEISTDKAKKILEEVTKIEEVKPEQLTPPNEQE